METSSKVDVRAPETRRARREAALELARTAAAPVPTAPVAPPAVSAVSPSSAPVPAVSASAQAVERAVAPAPGAVEAYGTVGREPARLVVPDLEPDDAPAAPVVDPAVALRPGAPRVEHPPHVSPYARLAREVPEPRTAWVPAAMPSISAPESLARAATEARATWRPGPERAVGVSPAAPSAVTDTGPVPRQSAAPSPVAVDGPADTAARRHERRAVVPVERLAAPVDGPELEAPVVPSPATPTAQEPTAAAQPAARPRTRREMLEADGRRRPSSRPARTGRGTWTARAGVLATLAVATVAVPVAQGLTPEDAVAEVRDYAEGRSTLDVLTSPRGLAEQSVIVADTLAGRDAEVASRAAERTSLTGCDLSVVVAKGANGRLGGEQLCGLPQGGHHLQPQAAESFTALNAQYRARFGKDICISDSYRSLSGQYSVAATKPGLAARPGTSQHGMGLALDLCPSTYSVSVQWNWLKANGPIYGFDNPAWARAGGSGAYEPWHWEYFPLVQQ